MTGMGTFDEKDAMSHLATTSTQNTEWMMLWSGTTLEQKEMTDEDEAIAMSPEVKSKMEDINTSKGYLGSYGMKLEDRKGVDLSQIKVEVSEQTPKEDKICCRKLRMRMVIQEEDEILMLIIKPLQRRLRDLGLNPGYSNKS
jgi:hypothetical protein